MVLKIDKKDMPELMVIFKIIELFPDRLIPVSIEHKMNGTWGCALCELIDGNVMGKTIFALNDFDYRTEELARSKMNLILGEVDKARVAMSN
tara:strand:- start:381 stop:656 length:276 start_codon:yes stop_codon:yes gene_type:complete